MVDLSSTQWTPDQRLQWREQVTPPLAVISLVFCVGAAVIYYIFPRLRVFPRSILSWINVYNIIFDAYIIAKWFPGSIARDPMVIHLQTGTAACKIGLFMDNFTISGAVACDTLIALTVFLVVIMGVNLEVNKHRYFEGYLAFAVGYALLMGFVAAFGFGTATTQAGNPCVVNSTFGQGLLVYPSIALVIIQLILILWALAYVRSVLSMVSSSAATNFPVKYLIVRFLVIFFAQLYNVAATQLYVLLPSTQNNAVWSRFCFVSHLTGGTVDAIILTLGNVDFVDWMKNIFDKIFRRRRRVEIRNMHKELPVLSSNESPDSLIEVAAHEVIQMEDTPGNIEDTTQSLAKLPIIQNDQIVGFP